MADTSTDSSYMDRALTLARQAVGQTSPNPAVGAVIIHEGEIVGEGFHARAGTPHAERVAIADAERNGFSQWKEATLYCTLEPCSTHGRTGACSEALLEKQFKRVVYGATDVNPNHAGRVDEIFRKAGIEVSSGVREKECQYLIRGFSKGQRTGLPWVIIKSAMSLDGKITRPSGESQWLTSPASRHEVHKLRAEVDAIITGGNTVRMDDPALTVRLEGRSAELRAPVRVVLTRNKETLPPEAKLLRDPETLIYEDVDLEETLRDLYKQGLNTVLVEAGGALLGSLVDAGLVDEAVMFFAPILTGGGDLGVAGEGAASLAEVLKLENVQYLKIGDDVMARGLVVEKKPR